MLKTRDRTRCPSCGERVMPFAAGCALCGADLDTTRFDRGPSLIQRFGSWLGAIAYGPSMSIPALLIVAAIGYLLLVVL